MARAIVTLTTDFGHNDHFVGTMKGVILKLAPDTEIVDISHEVRPYDILDGAFTIAQSYSYFPNNTIHMVVVDPGVGTARRPIIMTAGVHRFVAPDNGVLSFIYVQEPEHTVRHVTSEHYFLSPVSQTFQGRDVFAPCAGWLARGVEMSKFGDPVTDFVRFAPPKPKVLNEKQIQGVIIKVDRFGNLITNLTPEDVPGPFKMIVGKSEVTKFNTAYAQSPVGEVFIIVGSSGYLELSANKGSAARILQVDRGAPVGVVLG